MLTLIFSTALGKSEEKRCRPGWELHGDLCRRWNESDLVPWCEKGSYLNGVCVVDYQPYGQCIDGGSLVDGMCEHYHMEKPTTICPDGYKIRNGHDKKNNYCEKLVPVKVLDDCSNGSVEFGTKCQSFNYVDQEYQCPKGQDLDGIYCVKTEYYNCTQQSFPHGESKKHLKSKSHHRRLGKKDATTTYGVPDIHVDSEYLVESICERESRTLAVTICPEGSYRYGKQCKIEHIRERKFVEHFTAQRAPIESVCPIPYQWCDSKLKHSDSACCHVEVEEPVWDCPSGTVMSQKGCIAKFDPLYICADGKKKKHDECSEWEYDEPYVVIVTSVEEKKKKKHHHH